MKLQLTFDFVSKYKQWSGLGEVRIMSHLGIAR